MHFVLHGLDSVSSLRFPSPNLSQTGDGNNGEGGICSMDALNTRGGRGLERVILISSLVLAPSLAVVEKGGKGKLDDNRRYD